MQDIVKNIEFHTLPIVNNLNLELWGVEVQEGAKTLVRIFLENAGIDECTQVSRLLGLVLDIEEIFDNPWVLEVSTPGLDRTFFNIEQLKSFLGEILFIGLNSPIHSENEKPRRKLQAKLVGVLENTFIVQIIEDGVILDREPVEIEWDNVKKIKVIPQFEEIQKPITKKKK